MAYIHVNFDFLSQSIRKLEKTTNPLSETIKEINDFQDKLSKTNGSKADTVKRKSCSCFSKNEVFKTQVRHFMCVRGSPSLF
jgi:hypothetical protein